MCMTVEKKWKESNCVLPDLPFVYKEAQVECCSHDVGARPAGVSLQLESTEVIGVRPG